MTENKRFQINGKEIIQNKQVWCMANSEHCADVIATAMNELADENEQLKKELNEIKRQEQEVFEYLQAYHQGNVENIKR